MGNGTEESIREVIEKAYIQGIHELQDEKMVNSGFHKDFAMLVLQDNELEKVAVDEWLPRVEVLKQENPELWAEKTRHTFEFVDVAGYAAVAKLEVFKGDTFFSADYLLLYKFEGGWKIVSKIFSTTS